MSGNNSSFHMESEEEEMDTTGSCGHLMRADLIRTWQEVNVYNLPLQSLFDDIVLCLHSGRKHITSPSISCCRRIYDMGKQLSMPWKTVGTAMVLVQRYAQSRTPLPTDEQDLAEVPMYEGFFERLSSKTKAILSYSCLLLASKLEETLFSLRVLTEKHFETPHLKDVGEAAQLDHNNLPTLVKEMEQDVLVSLGFRLTVRHLRHFRLLQLFNLLDVPDNVQRCAMQITNLALLAGTSVIERPELYAVTTLFVAAQVCKFDITLSSSNGLPVTYWWSLFNARTRLMRILFGALEPLCAPYFATPVEWPEDNAAEISMLAQEGLLLSNSNVDSGRPLRIRMFPNCRSIDMYVRNKRISEGTYGTVYLAKDLSTDEVVAIKKMKRTVSRSGFPYYMLREIHFLFRLNHPNIVAGKEMVISEDKEGNITYYIVMEFISTDMLSLLRHQASIPREQRIRLSQVKNVMLQLLNGVTHMHEQGLMHRDLKLANLLITRDGRLKVADLGSVRDVGRTNLKLTTQIVTLWYRAPELLMGGTDYSYSIDMWSVGCLFIELLTLKPLFPGRSEEETLWRIFKILGRPPPDVWQRCMAHLPLASDLYARLQSYDTAGTVQKLVPFLSPSGMRFVLSMLSYDPALRITARQAFEHPFLREKPLPQPIDLSKTGMITPYDEVDLELEAEAGTFDEAPKGTAPSAPAPAAASSSGLPALAQKLKQKF